MAAEKKCLKCGSTSLEPGALHSAYFQPDNTKFLTLNPNVRIRATICMVCGYIELNGDLSKTQDLTETGR
jgi:predicted nucleic-acid-binding Zn-ribbon protein